MFIIELFKKLFGKKKYIEKQEVDITVLPKEETKEDTDEPAEYDDTIEDYGDEEPIVEDHNPGLTHNFEMYPDYKVKFEPGSGINTRHKYFQFFSESMEEYFVAMYIRIKYNGNKKVPFSEDYLGDFGLINSIENKNDVQKFIVTMNLESIFKNAIAHIVLDKYPLYNGQEDNDIEEIVHMINFKIPYKLEDGTIYDLDAFLLIRDREYEYYKELERFFTF
jgi:hypothetical protein